MYQLRLNHADGTTEIALANALTSSVSIAIFARPGPNEVPPVPNPVWPDEWPESFFRYVTYEDSGVVDSEGVPIYVPVEEDEPLTVVLSESLNVRVTM